jgi:hypothetical protein
MVRNSWSDHSQSSTYVAIWNGKHSIINYIKKWAKNSMKNICHIFNIFINSNEYLFFHINHKLFWGALSEVLSTLLF